jgi:hypothetical protein
MKKNQNMVVWPQENDFALLHIEDFPEVGTRCNKDVHLLEESVVNMIGLFSLFLTCES